MKILIQQLLIRSSTTESLKECIIQFEKEFGKWAFAKQKDIIINGLVQKVPEIPLFYLLLKVYSSIDQELTYKQLKTFSGVYTKLTVDPPPINDNFSNLRLQWMTLFVLRQVGDHIRTYSSSSRYENDIQSLVVQENYFLPVCFNFANELLLQKNL